MKKRKIIAIFLAVLLLFSLWYARFGLLYHYYLWRLEHSTESAEIIDIIEKIESISSHITYLSELTYQDVNAPYWSRHAAAISLSKANKARAELIFLNIFKKEKDEKIISKAIIDLGRIKSKKAYYEIVLLRNSKDENIRNSVVDYLGKIGDKNSIILLKETIGKDTSKKVRENAKYQLQLMGVLQSDNCIQ